MHFLHSQIKKSYIAIANFYLSFLLISVVFLHIVSSKSDNSYTTLKTILPNTKVKINPKKLVPINSNDIKEI